MRLLGSGRRWYAPAVVGLAAAVLTMLAVPATAAGPLLRVSFDPFTNAGSQHATEVEPDTFGYGSTIVAASQVGRFTDGGASDLGWDTSTDAGATWQHGTLPGITVYRGGRWARVSDPSVAYDAKHHTWLIAGLVLDATPDGRGVTVSRSASGLAWQAPVLAVGNDNQSYDKSWIVCDNTANSPYFGRCYVEVDRTSAGNLMLMSTSSDGGATWSPAKAAAGSPSGLGGQPLVQPGGAVVVPYSANGGSIRSFLSTNGGSSWGSDVLVANVQAHFVAGGLRDGEGLPSAEVDAAGKVYVAWQDCRFRTGCTANDIVYSTSANGTGWSAVTRIPIDATGSGVDHFIPGLGVNRASSGSTAQLGLYYYFYPHAKCTVATCQLEVGFISSTNGGAGWSTATTVAGPMKLSQIAATTQGRMVGDYISCSILNGGKAYAIFAVGKAPINGKAFNEAMYTAGGLPVRGGAARGLVGGAVQAGRPVSGRTAR
ncbi:MAG: exo-alpha-sialidase [Actinomycetota bacterium]|nr:exo-alpha-sialidase [Actinomycetota bacterium]